MKSLEEMTSKELKEKAKELKVANWWNLKKEDLIVGIKAKTQSTTDESKHENAQETMKMSETIEALESIYDKLNGIYFENSLPKAVITVQSTPKAYGHCSTKKIWKADDSEMYEINLGAEFINRPIADTAATLTHEMIHLYCLLNEIADTCQNGRYHNKTFKQEAEARNLAVDYDRANGYTHTKPTDEFVNKLTEAGIDMTIKFARVMKAKVKAIRPKPHKYVCPSCGQTVKTTANLNLICGNCDEEMTCE